ncbi:MAG: 3',5'-cyclic-nucleotide phosphodiesterase [Burkholderiaceae bacterium]
MKIRVLGCSGAIARGCRTTSFLVDDSILIDAGTGVGDLSLDEMACVRHVFLTHSHLDHVAALPLMLDAVGARLPGPLQVHGLPATLQALQAHVFNNVIWPDFARIPSSDRPFLQYCPLDTGVCITLDGLDLEVLPAKHTVPAVGYALRGERGWWVFSGDTGRNPAFWTRLQRMEVAVLVIETAFSGNESVLADRSGHLSSPALAQELVNRPGSPDYPIFITHTKPSEADLIIQEIRHITAAQRQRDGRALDIQMLAAGQVMYI